MGYISFPGAATDYASTVDTAELSIVGNIEIVAKVTLDDWSPTTGTVILSKAVNSTNRGYVFDVQDATGKLRLQWTEGGGTSIAQVSTAGFLFTDGDTGWVKATLDVDNDASGYDLDFFKSSDTTDDPDSVNWTKVGDTVVGGATTDIEDNAAVLRHGWNLSFNYGGPCDLHYCQVKSGIGGSLVYDANFTDLTVGEVAAKEFVEDSVNAATVTLNGVLWTYTFDGEPINRTNIVFVAAD